MRYTAPLIFLLFTGLCFSATASAQRPGGKRIERRINKTAKQAKKREQRREMKEATRGMPPAEKKAFKEKVRSERREARAKWKALNPEEKKAFRQEKRAERKARAKSRRTRAREQARTLMGGKKPPAPLKQEFRRHARRMARLDRIRSVAVESDDEKILARLDKLRDREKGRHQKWLAGFKERNANKGDN